MPEAPRAAEAAAQPAAAEGGRAAAAAEAPLEAAVVARAAGWVSAVGRGLGGEGWGRRVAAAAEALEGGRPRGEAVSWSSQRAAVEASRQALCVGYRIPQE